MRISTVHPESDPDSGESFYRIVEETTANLSRGGAFVASWEPLEAGRRVLVEISLPDNGPPLQIVARVAWTRRQLRAASLATQSPSTGESVGDPTGPGPGYGLEFIGGSKAELARLAAHLESIKARATPSATPSSSQPLQPLQPPQTPARAQTRPRSPRP